MKKLELIILVLILCGIIIGDLILYKVYNHIEYTRSSIIKENYAGEKELHSDLQYIANIIPY